MTDTTEPYKFSGFSSPNTTPVPDVLFDELLLQLDNAELRVLLYIIRRTYGFKKNSDDISIGQMVDGITRKDGTVLDGGTGLARSSVKRAISGLLEKRIIVRKHNQANDGGNEPNTYGLRYDKASNEADNPRSNSAPTPLVSPADPPRYNSGPHKKQLYNKQILRIFEKLRKKQTTNQRVLQYPHRQTAA
jgi:phage replication O-like protein O